MELCDVPVETAGSGEDVGRGWDNTVVARSSIISEFDVVRTGHDRVVVLHEFKENGVQCLFVGKAAVTARVELIIVEAFLDEFPELDSQDQIIIILVEVNDAEAVEEGVTWFFFDHSIDDFMPARKAITVAGCVVNRNLVELPEIGFGVVKDCPFGCVVNTVRVE
jgi:hypothetical protein